MSIQDRVADNVDDLAYPAKSGELCRSACRPLAAQNVSVALARQMVADNSERKLLGVPWMLVQPLMLAYPAVFILGKIFNVSVAPLPLAMFIVSGLAV